MKKTLLITAIVLVAAPALAQTFLPNPTDDEIRAPRPARARGIPVALAWEAALVANAMCREAGFRSTTVVVDSEGVPILMASDDGATAMSQRAAAGKAMIAVKTKGPSADGNKADPAIMASLGRGRGGGFPLMAGNDVVGALAVGGTPTAKQDEACAQAGIAKIQARIPASAVVPPSPVPEKKP
jgi:uncharacterized protein GlcG (DUF336 family)